MLNSLHQQKSGSRLSTAAEGGNQVQSPSQGSENNRRTPRLAEHEVRATAAAAAPPATSGQAQPAALAQVRAPSRGTGTQGPPPGVESLPGQVPRGETPARQPSPRGVRPRPPAQPPRASLPFRRGARRGRGPEDSPAECALLTPRLRQPPRWRLSFLPEAGRRRRQHGRQRGPPLRPARPGLDRPGRGPAAMGEGA